MQHMKQLEPSLRCNHGCWLLHTTNFLPASLNPAAEAERSQTHRLLSHSISIHDGSSSCSCLLPCSLACCSSFSFSRAQQHEAQTISPLRCPARPAVPPCPGQRSRLAASAGRPPPRAEATWAAHHRRGKPLSLTLRRETGRPPPAALGLVTRQRTKWLGKL